MGNNTWKKKEGFEVREKRRGAILYNCGVRED